MQTVTRDYKSLPHASVCGLSLYIGQRNDVLLRPKIGKIVINPIPLLMTMYSIRAPETPLVLFALESMEKVVFWATPIWTVGKS